MSLVDALAAAPGPIVQEVVLDVARPGDDPAAVAAEVDPVVRRLLAGLVAAPGRRGEDARLRDEGANAARAGMPVAVPLDRHLSAGWAIWDAATRRPDASRDGLAALGAALLRAGDAAAAAIAEGHGAAEREMAGRIAAARRALVDELLDLDGDDPTELTRLRLRGDAIGIRVGGAYRVVALWLGDELDEAALERGRLLELAQTGIVPARPVGQRRGPGHRTAAGSPAERPAEPLMAIRSGRLIVAIPTERFDADRMRAALASSSAGGSWLGVIGPVVGPGQLRRSIVDALGTLAIARAAGFGQQLADADAVALERALLADRTALARALEWELGPILRAPRNAATLVDTLRVWVEHGQSVRPTARAMGVAPRTIAYRLERMEQLLGRPLAGPVVARLAAALLARALLERASIAGDAMSSVRRA